MELDQLRPDLLSDDAGRRIHAALRAPLLGQKALDIAVAILVNHLAPQQSRFWALQAVAQFTQDRARVGAAATHALRDPDAGVRSLAIQIVEDLRFEPAIPALEQLQDDTATNQTWWDDISHTIAESAHLALQSFRAHFHQNST